MKGRHTLILLFVFLIVMSSLSLIWIVININNNLNLFFKEIVLFLILIIAFVSIITAIYFIFMILKNIKYSILEENKKEKAVRDYYRYTELIDPPNLDT